MSAKLGNVVAWSCVDYAPDLIDIGENVFAHAETAPDAGMIVTRHNAEVAELQRRIAELEKDKARLDWMEKRPVYMENFTRAAIDAAMEGE